MATRGDGVRIAVLASGRGSNLEAIARAIDDGQLHAQLVLVGSHRIDAGAMQYAARRGIPTHHIDDQTQADPGAALLEALRSHRSDLLVLAGYLRKVPAVVVEAFEGRALNIHPAPLPRFGGRGMYGLAVHRAVLAAGVATTGPTVHRVTADYDEGEVLAHVEVPVRAGDTAERLAARVLAAEHDLYWRVIATVAAELGGPDPQARAGS